MSDNSPRPSKRQRIEHECSDPDNKISTDGADEVTITCAYCTCYLEDLEDIDEYDARIKRRSESKKESGRTRETFERGTRQVGHSRETGAEASSCTRQDGNSKRKNENTYSSAS